MTRTESLDVTHQRAARVGAQVEIDDIRLTSLNAELLNPASEGPYSIQIGLAPSVSQIADRLLFECSYRIDVKGVADDEALRLECKFLAAYTLSSSDEHDIDDLVAFGEITVLRALHPYIRELFQSTSARLGLPGLTLGVFRVPIPVPKSIPAKRSPKKALPKPKKP